MGFGRARLPLASPLVEELLNLAFECFVFPGEAGALVAPGVELPLGGTENWEEIGKTEKALPADFAARPSRCPGLAHQPDDEEDDAGHPTKEQHRDQ